MKNLIGIRFGKLVVSRQAENDKRQRWHCHCDCGSDKLVRGWSLTSGEAKSCGCVNIAEDLTGRRYGRLIVVSRHPSPQKRVYWNCFCDCGIKTFVDAGHLRNGHTKSCGCFGREQLLTNNPKPLKVLTGMRFGKLTARERGPNSQRSKTTYGRVRWWCDCDCGKRSLVRALNLGSGAVTSCGCKRTEGNNLSGLVFGKLTAISLVRKKVHGISTRFWLCKCQCGRQTEIRASTLIDGRSRSCGCAYAKTERPASGRKLTLREVKSAYKHRSAKGLHDSYIKEALQRSVKLRTSDIPPSAIVLKRSIIKLKRIIRAQSVTA